MKIKVGFGYDIHQLVEGRDLIIGGVKIDHHKGALGHSDADCLLHAICDALLGAANLGDIGTHFPDTDPKYKGVDSQILLSEVGELVRTANYEIGNLDCTICLEKPKLKPHIGSMQKVISACLNIPIEDISIKATTSEKMSFVGEENGIKAYAVCLVEKNAA